VIESYQAEFNRVEKLYECLFHEIYTGNFDKGNAMKQRYFSHSTFFDAWKLRGDDPKFYFGKTEKTFIRNLISIIGKDAE